MLENTITTDHNPLSGEANQPMAPRGEACIPLHGFCTGLTVKYTTEQGFALFFNQINHFYGCNLNLSSGQLSWSNSEWLSEIPSSICALMSIAFFNFIQEMKLIRWDHSSCNVTIDPDLLLIYKSRRQDNFSHFTLLGHYCTCVNITYCSTFILHYYNATKFPFNINGPIKILRKHRFMPDRSFSHNMKLLPTGGHVDKPIAQVQKKIFRLFYQPLCTHHIPIATLRASLF